VHSEKRERPHSPLRWFFHARAPDSRCALRLAAVWECGATRRGQPQTSQHRLTESAHCAECAKEDNPRFPPHARGRNEARWPLAPTLGWGRGFLRGRQQAVGVRGTLRWSARLDDLRDSCMNLRHRRLSSDAFIVSIAFELARAHSSDAFVVSIAFELARA